MVVSTLPSSLFHYSQNHNFNFNKLFCSADWEAEKAAEDDLRKTKAAQDEVRKAQKVFQIYNSDVVICESEGVLH